MSFPHFNPHATSSHFLFDGSQDGSPIGTGGNKPKRRISSILTDSPPLDDSIASRVRKRRCVEVQPALSEEMEDGALSRHEAATRIQATFRGFMLRKKLLQAQSQEKLQGLIGKDLQLFQSLQACQARACVSREKGILDIADFSSAMRKLEGSAKFFRKIDGAIHAFAESKPTLGVDEFCEEYEERLEELEGKLYDYGSKYGAAYVMDVLKIASDEDSFTPEGLHKLAQINQFFSPTGFRELTVVRKSGLGGGYEITDFEGKRTRSRKQDYYGHDHAFENGLPFFIRPEFHKITSLEESVHGAELMVPMSPECESALIIKGHFNNDPLNLRVLESEFTRKKEEFQVALALETEVPDTFKERFLNQYGIRDFILASPEECVEEMLDHYAEVEKMFSSTSMELPVNFAHANLVKQSKVIRSLLMMNEPGLVILLYGLLKEHAPEFARMIRNSLHFSLQRELDRVEENFEEMKERLDELSEEDVPLETRILTSSMDDATKALALSKARSIDGSSGSEEEKTRKWVNGLLKLPLGKFSSEPVSSSSSTAEIAAYVKKIQSTLDSAVHGHQEAKTQLMRVLGQWVANEGSGGEVIAIQGPPGNGKTTFAKEGVAKALGRPFCFIPLGGAQDSSFLIGHDFTYVGSKWGHIANVLMEAGSMNPVIYVDELDKLSRTEKGQEIVGVLTHLIDSSQNQEFHDVYFEGVKIDLSRALFIFSYNDESLIDPILKDRMITIRTKALNKGEKQVIAEDFLMPKILQSVGMEPGSITVSQKMIEYIIENYTHEAGVRRLKESLFAIAREINLERLLDPSLHLPVAVNEAIIHKCLKEPRVRFDHIGSFPRVGTVNGLYATSDGTGGLTIIQAFRTIGKEHLKLQLTGSQGDVMQESMSAARTVAWNLLPEEKQQELLAQEGFGLHLHVPDTAQPKDGPSAGGAITASIISQITGIPIRNDVAMTGEIDLNGAITAIGGLEYKLVGAKRAGVRHAIVPLENEREFREACKDLPDLIDATFKVTLVDNIWDLLEHVLVPNDYSFCRFSEDPEGKM